MLKPKRYFAHYFIAHLGIGEGWLEMPNKKQTKNLLRKATTILFASVVALCMMALPLGTFAPEPVKAAVTTSDIAGPPPGMMIGPGMLTPAVGINVAGASDCFHVDRAQSNYPRCHGLDVTHVPKGFMESPQNYDTRYRRGRLSLVATVAIGQHIGGWGTLRGSGLAYRVDPVPPI